MNQNKDTIFQTLAILSVIAILAGITVIVVGTGEAKSRALRALQLKQATEHATFTKGEYQNTSQGTWWIFRSTQHDYHKTRIAGEYVGRKGKTFVKGVIEGLKSDEE